jgi:hypothetical protein
MLILSVELDGLTYGPQNHANHQLLEGCGGRGGLVFFVPIRLCMPRKQYNIWLGGGRSWQHEEHLFFH